MVSNQPTNHALHCICGFTCINLYFVHVPLVTNASHVHVPTVPKCRYDTMTSSDYCYAQRMCNVNTNIWGATVKISGDAR